MKRQLIALLSLALLVAVASASNFTRGKRDGLKIYIFDVGQAMSQLWIYPSGYTVFVDAPETHWNSGETSKRIAGKLDNLLNGSKTIDVAVLSHLHLDHVGYAGTGGLWALIEVYGFNFKRIIDRDSGKWVDRNGDGNCTDDEIDFYNMGTTSTTSTQWICYATDPSSKVYPIREVAQLCSTSQISPPDSGAVVTIVAVDAY